MPLLRPLAVLAVPLAALSLAALPLAARDDDPAESSPRDGAPGLGDPYFPGAGNGGYDVLHYALDLDVDMEDGSVEASAVLDARALHALRSFHLDFVGLEVTGVAVDGRPAGFSRSERELRVVPARPVPTGEGFRVRVDYRGVPDVAPDPSVAAMGMAGTGWMRRDTGVFVMSQCIGAPGWFPCNDHPTDKATFSMDVTVAEPFVVAANGMLVEEVDHGDERTFSWRANDPMATYLATVNIAELEVELDEGHGDVFLRLYYPPGTESEALEPFRRTSEMLEFFSQRFGPYPFEAFGGVLTSERLGGALECQTLAVYSRGTRESTVAHELAHQWFGNCVSVREWEDLWLSEGFAVYAEWLWREETRGSDALARSVERVHRSVHRRRRGAPADPGVERLFSGRTYGRGPLVLHALRERVGDETFFRILRTWVERYFNGAATSEDFIALSEELSGVELDRLFDAWLYADVVPEPHEDE